MTAITRPEQLPKPEGALITFWIIYDHPKDYPHGYVLRAQWAMKGKTVASDIAWYAENPQLLRDILPPNVSGFFGDPNPHILECWME